MSADRTKAIRESFQSHGRHFPRINFDVSTLYHGAHGVDGTVAALSYPHRTGQDDDRESWSDGGRQDGRIRRLKNSEVDALGQLVAKVAGDFPECEVFLDDINRGEYIYYFIAK